MVISSFPNIFFTSLIYDVSNIFPQMATKYLKRQKVFELRQFYVSVIGSTEGNFDYLEGYDQQNESFIELFGMRINFNFN